MGLILPKRYMPGFSEWRVPTCPVEIDWKDPLAQGLVFCGIPAWGELVNHVPAQFYGNAKLSNGDHGVCCTTTDTTYDACFFTLPPTASIYALPFACTVAVLGSVSSADSSGQFLSIPYNPSTWYAPYSFGPQFSDGGFQMGVPSAGGVGQFALNTSTALASTFPTTPIVTTTGPGNQSYFYFGGQQYPGVGAFSNYAGTVGMGSKMPVTLYNSTSFGATTQGVQGNVYLGCVWNRILSLAEIWRWSNRPFSMLKLKRPLMMLSGAASRTYPKSNWLSF